MLFVDKNQTLEHNVVMESISQRVLEKINELEPGTIFTPKDFKYLNSPQAVQVTISRLHKQKIVMKLQRGLYYKPRETKFGTVGPSESDILKALQKNGHGHLAGHAIFNQKGLTTQVPTRVEFRTDKRMSAKVLGNLNLKFQGNPTKHRKGEENLVFILESLQNMKSIFDSDVNQIVSSLKSEITKMDTGRIARLITLSAKYRPFVRALLGAMIQKHHPERAAYIKKTLNPGTRYKVNVSESILPNLKEWNIENDPT